MLPASLGEYLGCKSGFGWPDPKVPENKLKSIDGERGTFSETGAELEGDGTLSGLVCFAGDLCPSGNGAPEEDILRFGLNDLKSGGPSRWPLNSFKRASFATVSFG